MYTHKLGFCIKGCKFFRRLIFDVTHHKSYGSGLTAVTEIHNDIVNILVDFFSCTDGFMIYCV